mmetsp:Transcript_15941/g.22708  ORF Transcript_15941/g.22708 Transcript_15941/m.22708 type:complete len:105 (-) Transcript_15941:589-903(-)
MVLRNNEVKPALNRKETNKNPNSFSKQKDCDRPACEETVAALSASLNRLKANQAINESIYVKTTNSSRSLGSDSDLPCPPTKDQIGKSSWTLLHTMVRNFANRM